MPHLHPNGLALQVTLMAARVVSQGNDPSERPRLGHYGLRGLKLRQGESIVCMVNKETDVFLEIYRYRNNMKR